MLRKNGNKGLKSSSKSINFKMVYKILIKPISYIMLIYEHLKPV